MNETQTTRRESLEKINRKKKQEQVLKCLGDKEMTAREVALEMYRRGYATTKERNEAAPRLTELFQLRKICIVAKKKDTLTNSSVVVYKKVTQ